MSDWKEYRLGDIISIAGGFAYKGNLIGQGDNYLLGMGCVSYNDNFLDKGARPYEGDCPERYYAKTGDIVLATRQQSDNLPILGMPAIIPSKYEGHKMIVGANLYRVEIKDHSFDNRYLYWLLKTPLYVNHIRSCQSGTTVRMITKANIEDFIFTAPSKEDRERIADLIWTLDDKIEVNKRINENLEQQAQALFKSWFVDFEPFKDQPFVESELGMIPQGWRVQGLGEVSRMNAGGDKPIVISDVPTELCKVPIYSNGLDNDGLYGFTNEARIIEPAVTISARGTIGDVNLRLTPYCPIVRLISIIPNPSIHVYYLYYALKNKRIEGVGTTQQQLTVPNFKREKIIIPTSGVIDSFKIILEPIIKKKRVNKIESRHLAELRDTLLPRLMSGELKVNDVDA